MEIGKTLQFFRKNNQLAQKELTSEKLDVLEEILDKMSVSTGEFFLRASFNDKQQKFQALYYECATDLNDRTKKRELVSYYQELLHKPKKLSELSHYISIANYFNQYWEEVKPLTQAEVEEIYHYIISRNYYQQMDYIIISNMIFLFDTERQIAIIEKALPLVDEDKRDETTKKFAYTILINFISTQIYLENLSMAREYLKKVKKQYNVQNIGYKNSLYIQYLDDLTNYLQTGDSRYFGQIQYFICLLNNIGDTMLSKKIQNEVRRVLHKQVEFANITSYPVGLLQ